MKIFPSPLKYMSNSFHVIWSEVLVAQSCPTLCHPWTVAYQAPLSMGFSRQEYRGGLLFPSSGDLPNPGIEPKSPALRADSLPAELPGKPLTIKTRVKISQFSNTFKVMHTPKFQGWKITCSSRKVVTRSEDPLETLPWRLGIQTQWRQSIRTETLNGSHLHWEEIYTK